MQAKRDEQTYAILGAAIEVHRTLGPGFLEPVYQEALVLEEPKVINYLKAGSLQRALLLNFGTKSLQYKRLVNNYQMSESERTENNKSGEPAD